VYRGKYEYNLGDKGRLFIPADFRRGLSSKAKGSFVVTKWFDKCLVLYPLDEWLKVESKLRQYPTSDAMTRRGVRWFTANAREVKLDSQGRIMVPKYLLEFAGINKEVTIIGVINRIEIWDTKVYESEGEAEPTYIKGLPDLNL